MGAEDREVVLSPGDIPRVLATLNSEQVAAVRTLLNQEKILRERLEQAIVALQERRPTAEELEQADREAEERKAQFIANREAAARVQLPEAPPPPPAPQVDLMSVIGALGQRLQAIEVALSSNAGHMARPVSPTVAMPPVAAPGFATLGAAPGLYNPNVQQNGYPWRR